MFYTNTRSLSNPPTPELEKLQDRTVLSDIRPLGSPIRLGMAASFAVVAVLCPGQSAAAVKRPPSPAAAQHAFGRWLHARYRSITGYWTCPRAQIAGDTAGCLAEVRVVGIRHLVFAAARMRNGRIAFVHSETRWVRRWSAYSRTLLRGGNRDLAGEASVNSPAFDWWWLAAGALGPWQRHLRSFVVSAFDGDSRGFGRFYNFSCRVGGRVLTCTNALGDAMRYRAA